MNELPAIIVFGPLVLGFILLFLPRILRYVSAFLTLLVTALVFAGAIYIFRIKTLTWSVPVFHLQQISFDLLLKSTPLSAFIILFAAGFAFLITVYSIKSFVDSRASNIYYGAMLLTTGASIGVLLSNHLLVLLFFWEIVTVALYLLITTGRENSNFAATKTFAMLGASDGALLLGILFLYKICGTFQISQISLTENSTLVIVAFLLMLTAAITKAGALPLHTWLPTSGEFSDASVMAILPGAIDKLLGIYLLVILVRPQNGMFPSISSNLRMVLAVIGAVSIIVAAMIAIIQSNMKKLLSYSAISQVGYMILGIATGTTIGLAGAVFHMLNNSIYKCCLFLCSGSVEQATGTAELEKLGGLGRKMPLTFAACFIAVLSISGVLPFNGFASKWMIYQSVIQMGTTQTEAIARFWPVWLIAATFGSTLTLAYCVKMIHSIFLSRLPDELKSVREVSSVMTLPMLLLAALCVIFGVAYVLPLRTFIYPALGFEDNVQFIGRWDSAVASFLLIAGLLFGLVIVAAAAIGKKARTVPTWTGGEIQPNDSMIIPGTAFYKTVSSLGGLKKFYIWQENEVFDPYVQTGKGGLSLAAFLRWLHNGFLPMYMSWVTLGLLVLLFVLCRVW